MSTLVGALAIALRFDSANDAFTGTETSAVTAAVTFRQLVVLAPHAVGMLSVVDMSADAMARTAPRITDAALVDLDAYVFAPLVIALECGMPKT